MTRKISPEAEDTETPLSKLRETVSTVVWALIIAFVLRTFVIQPFHIPSGSMQPTLVKGDYIITSKYSLGYGKYSATPIPLPIKSGRWFERLPERGDVIVFRPTGQNKNFIKRLVGLPGDEIQMRDGKLFINAQIVSLENLGLETRTDDQGRLDETYVYREVFDNGHNHRIYDTIENGPADETDSYIVPAGHYFMMGDNRDHSADSRVSSLSGGAGYVPIENMMGRAEIVLLSVKDDFSLFKPWTWFQMRGDRFFKIIR